MAGLPVTKYAVNGDVNIAYQVLGEGPPDLVLVPGFVSNVEILWESPIVARFLSGLASFSRLILFDKRGTGLSDRIGFVPDLETQIDDVRAVMDAAGSERAALCGYWAGGGMCSVFAAMHPRRVTALVLVASFARRFWAQDYPFGTASEEFRRQTGRLKAVWGTSAGMNYFAPSLANDRGYLDWWARFLRHGGSPSAAQAINDLASDIDIRHVLPTIQVPTLVLHGVTNRVIPIEHGRFLAEKIPNARLVELPSADHVPWGSDVDAILADMSEFLTGVRPQKDPERVLATVLFTDIVGSTETVATLGDARWTRLLEQHHAIVREQISAYRGKEIDTAGDGFFATFDGPARAVRCARAIGDALAPIGLKIRAGLHTGECEVTDAGVGGIAVHIGARVAALAGADEVLVSSTVKDLVVGSGIEFAALGTKSLKGVPGEWQLFQLVSC